MNRTAHHFFRFGVVLFLLGLFTGFVIPMLRNPRMGLSSHLEGVLNGIFLIVIGLIWPHLRLSPRAQTWALVMLVFGAYANWATTLLAAAWGTGALSPLTAPGFTAASWQEWSVTAGFISLSIAIIGGCGIVLYGLRELPKKTV